MGADRSLQILNVALFVIKKSDGEGMKSVWAAGTAGLFLFINGGFHGCSAVNKRKPWEVLLKLPLF